eukprot:4360354-Pyramimonas_sp.AAC.1
MWFADYSRETVICELSVPRRPRGNRRVAARLFGARERAVRPRPPNLDSETVGARGRRAQAARCSARA